MSPYFFKSQRHTPLRKAGASVLLSLIAFSACRPGALPGNSAFGHSYKKKVCGGLGSKGGVGGPHGLFAQLYSMDRSADRAAEKSGRSPAGRAPDDEPGDHGYSGVDDFRGKSKKQDLDMYFSELNAPTQRFSGFEASDGSKVKGDDGQVLSTYFSIRFESMLRLMPHDQVGHYQFALLADDGAVLRMREGSEDYSVIVDNDGDHAPRLGCATQSVYLTREMSKRIQIDYYQGPRSFTALALLWRHVESDDPQALDEPLCGETGTYLFFNPDKSPPAPATGWIQLMARGWNVVGPRNLYMPSHAGKNPCGEPEPDPSPTPSSTSTPTPSESPSPTPTVTVTPDPTPTPTPTVTASPEPTPEPTSEPTPTLPPTPTPTGTPCVGVGCGGGELGV